MATEAIVYSGLPFNTFERASHPAVATFIHALNPGYVILTCQRTAAQLLDEVYVRVKTQVDQKLSKQSLLNFTCDESTANNGERVYNLSVNLIAGGSYHLRSLSMKGVAANADDLARITKDELLEVTSNLDEEHAVSLLPRVNSLATDTCETMRSLYRKLSATPEFQSTFFVLCDSHGLQLLVKDVLGHGQWLDVMKRINTVAVYFKRAKRALSILRECMDDIGEGSGFTLACITRWGSHYGVVRGVLRAMKALKRYAANPEVANLKASPEVSELGKLAISCLNSRAFWLHAEQLEQLLRPIHRAQIQSESNSASVGSVVGRWQAIRRQFVEFCEQYCYESDELLKLFDTRFTKQTTAIHWAAMSLNPLSAGCILALPPGRKREVTAFFRQYVPTSEWPEFNNDLRCFHRSRHRMVAFSTQNHYEI